MNTIQLKIIGLDTIYVNEDIISIVAPGTEGSFGVLAGHTPMVSSLKAGSCEVTYPNGSRKNVDIKGGVLSVSKNKITVLVE